MDIVKYPALRPHIRNADGIFMAARANCFGVYSVCAIVAFVVQWFVDATFNDGTNWGLFLGFRVLTFLVVFKVVAAIAYRLFGHRLGFFQTWCIRWWTNTEKHPIRRWAPWTLAEIGHPSIVCVSHVGGDDNGIWVTEQVGNGHGGCRVVRLSWLLRTYPGQIYHKPFLGTDEERIAVTKKAVELQGGEYANLLQYLVVAFGIKKDISSGRDCSEAAAECYGPNQVTDSPFTEPFSQYTPIDIWNAKIFGEATKIEL